MPDQISRYGNYSFSMDGTKLIIAIETDPAKVDIQPSSSGKSLVIATTGGAKHPTGMSDATRLNLTLYVRR